VIALPELRGRIEAEAKLAPTTWFRVGGTAEMLVRPADSEDLSTLLAGLSLDMPITVLGAASNIIVRDGGVHGVVIRLGRGFSEIIVEADAIIAGAACLDVVVAEHAAASGLAGLEFLCGIPGSIGGAVAMNAGAYGGDMAGCLDWADLVTRDGSFLRLFAPDLAFAYRHARLPAGAIVTRARLRAQPGERAAIAGRMGEIRRSRESSQPVRARTGGSTFRNPPAMKAWELIDAAGCRGARLRGAMVSEQHCNFLINTGDATASDIENLGELVRQNVETMSGIRLEWEIRRIGFPQQERAA
jgi:UDP-N-acetylmuramate dehydrogenase